MAYPTADGHCLECFSPFYGLRKTARYCGYACRKNADRRYTAEYRKRNPHLILEIAKKAKAKRESIRLLGWSRKCRVCSDEFSTKSPTATTCSDKCRYRSRSGTLAKRYGISPARVESALVGQGGKCAICGAIEADQRRRLSIDHNHATGAFRGLLCERCNLGIGYFCDSPDLLESAANYLARATVSILKIGGA
jgi:hypothetical protein